ncbi:hypothetical protein NP493_941g00009 [Ridgeia piscesae]|uniref:Uncharacterized protein n=1 Tax=Ridgeia piscesae TaxID=27915 RepID=A0AAD9NLD7_RIDPI|nr:hypothetical protein NP493_941g00009 [Ridgeia piscesae]
MSSRMVALLSVLLGLIAAGADQCVFRKGRCSYQLQMSESCDGDTGEMQSDITPTRERDLAWERGERQQQRLIADLERKFSDMLDKANSACAKRDTPQRAQAYANKRNAQYNRKQSQKNENSLMSKLHQEFRTLRSALAGARRRLRKSERRLTTTQAELNRSVAGTKELGKLLLTSETNLVNTQRDNAQLKRELHDRNRELNSTKLRLNASEAELEEITKRAKDLEKENDLLRTKLKSCRTELEMTRLMLERALKKYHELNVRHANTSRQLEAARVEVLECYRGR